MQERLKDVLEDSLECRRDLPGAGPARQKIALSVARRPRNDYRVSGSDLCLASNAFNINQLCRSKESAISADFPQFLACAIPPNCYH
jgi:hypothetical protein